MSLRTAARRNVVCGVAGVALCLCAPVAWVLTLDVPVLMHTGAAAWLCIALGLTLGVLGMRRDTRTWLRAFVAADLVIAGLLAWGAYGFARLPEAALARSAERAPEFDLVDHSGKPVRLSDELARGPVLLVFFRGSW
jgi:hypothetical protein